MNKSLEALKHLYAKLSCKSSIEEIDENLQEYEIIEKDLEVLEIIKRAPFILQVLYSREELPTGVEHHYEFGTITESELTKVKEWLNK